MIFSTLSANAYETVLMSETTLLFDPDPADLLHAGHVESLYGHFLNGSNYNLSKSLPHAQGWEKLDPSSYISKYDKSFITDYHDLVLITQNTSFDRVVEFRKAGELALDLGSLKEPAYEQWMFRDRDDRIVKNKVGSVVTPETVMPGGKLMVFGQEIGYCLAERVEAKCTLNFHVSLCWWCCLVLSRLGVFGRWCIRSKRSRL